MRERAVGDVGLGVIALVLAGIGAYALLRQACIGGWPGRAFLFGRPAGAINVAACAITGAMALLL